MPHPSSPESQRAALSFAALGDARRYEIVKFLARAGEGDTRDICREIGVHETHLSKFLSPLRQSGLIVCERRSHRNVYTIGPRLAELALIFAGMLAPKASGEVEAPSLAQLDEEVA